MSVLRLRAASAITSPPLPPSPPSGPPNSMNFSRRKPRQPAPPLPERMKTMAWSRNFMVGVQTKRGNGDRSPFADPVGRERLFGRYRRCRGHAHLDLAARAGAEADHAIGGGE